MCIYTYIRRCLLKAATTEGPALHSLLLAAELEDASFPAAALLTRLRKSAKEVWFDGRIGASFPGEEVKLGEDSLFENKGLVKMVGWLNYVDFLKCGKIGCVVGRVFCCLIADSTE